MPTATRRPSMPIAIRTADDAPMHATVARSLSPPRRRSRAGVVGDDGVGDDGVGGAGEGERHGRGRGKGEIGGHLSGDGGDRGHRDGTGTGTGAGKRTGTGTGAGHRPGAETDRQFSNNLARGLDVLRAFTPADPMLGNRDLADRTGLPKPTISRLTYTLTLLGYLSYVDRLQKYRLGPGVLSMGYPLLASLQVRQVARPIMERIARETGCTVNLGMRDRCQVVYVDTCRVDHGNLYQPDIGSSRPLLLTSIGRAIVVACPADQRLAILNRIKVQEPDQHAAGAAFWAADLASYQQRGFCQSRGDWRKEVHAVAVPIRLPQREEAVALNCTISAHRLARDTLQRKVAPLLVEGVRAIEAACGVL